MTETAIATAPPTVKAPPVIVLHVEDQRSWRIILESTIDKKCPGALYKAAKGTVADAMREAIASTENCSVLIADLHLGDLSSQYDSIDTLLDNAGNLLGKNISLFIVSGYITQETEVLLSRRGVPRSHIFQKEDFDENRFIAELHNEMSRLRKHCGECDFSNDDVLEIQAYVVAKRSVIQFSTEYRVRYELIVDIVNLLNIGDNPDHRLDRRLDMSDSDSTSDFPEGEVVIFAYSEEVEVFPERRSVLLRDCSQGNVKIIFGLRSLANYSSTLGQSIHLLLYRSNHLILHLNVPFEVNVPVEVGNEVNGSDVGENKVLSVGVDEASSAD